MKLMHGMTSLSIIVVDMVLKVGELNLINQECLSIIAVDMVFKVVGYDA